MQLYTSIVVTIFLSNLVVGIVEPDNYKLEQLQILFRHGDRTPDESEIFPNDPNNEIYQSYGYRQLTKIGKQRMYKIGQFLRKRYDAFLGEYKNNEVYAYSSNLDRTKMSLQLVLTGLYPSSPTNSWSNSINWQPIPTYYEDFDKNFLSTIECPSRAKIHDKSYEDPKVIESFKKYQSFYQRIENETGVTLPAVGSANFVYNNLRSALSLGLPLPSWCSKEDYHELEKIVGISFTKIMLRTEFLRRMFAGLLNEQFLKVLTDEKSSKKIYLYSGHDLNVSGFIYSHNITGMPEIQDYGNTLIMERLRGANNQKYIRLYLRTGVTAELFSLKLPNCDFTCPLSNYKKIVQPILPNDAARICYFEDKILCRR